MSNVDNLEICHFVKFFWEQSHQRTFVTILLSIHYCLLFAAKLASVYHAIYFTENTGTEFFIPASCHRLPNPN